MPESDWRRFVPVVHGYVCEVCGLSDFGFGRFLMFGFDPHPCRRCLDHFMPVQGPTPSAGSSSARLVPPSTDTTDSSEAGTLS